MQSKKIKTDKLKGTTLDWAVAQAIGVKTVLRSDGLFMDTNPSQRWMPSTDWSQGGPLISQFKVMLDHDFEEFSTQEEPCYAESQYFWAIGESELIALCRAIVKRHLGETVPVPPQLLPEGQ